MEKKVCAAGLIRWLAALGRTEFRPTRNKYGHYKSKIVLCHSSAGHKHAFQEVLNRPELQSRLANTKAVSEVRVLADFNKMLKKDLDRAVYGPAHVKFPCEMGAMENLLVTDKLFRAADIATRKKYVQLVEEVKTSGATVNVFSTQHVTGEQLDLMSGVAATVFYDSHWLGWMWSIPQTWFDSSSPQREPSEPDDPSIRYLA